MWIPFSNIQYQSSRLCHLGLFDESRNWVSGYLSCVAVHNNSCCVCVAKIWQLDRGKMNATFSEVYKGELWLSIQTSFYACLLSFSFFSSLFVSLLSAVPIFSLIQCVHGLSRNLSSALSQAQFPVDMQGHWLQNLWPALHAESKSQVENKQWNE